MIYQWLLSSIQTTNQKERTNLNHYVHTHYNEATILEFIVQHSEISRSKLAKLSNLTKSSISDITKTLIEKSLVYESSTGKSSISGGRKPILLSFNETSALVIAIEIGKNYIQSFLSFINGKLVKKIKYDDILVTKDTLIPFLKCLISDLTIEKPESPYGVVGVGIAIHGIVKDDAILFTPYSDIDSIPLIKMLSEEIPYPIYLINEANAGALGEYTFNTSSENLININIQDGIGAGIVEDGKLFTGAHGSVGEIGHTTLYPDGILCPCGNHGCLEQYSSTRVLLKELFDSSNDQVWETSEIAKMWHKEDPHTRKTLRNNAKLLSIGINNIVLMYDPDVVIINSEIYRAIPELIPEIKKHLTGKNTKNITIRNSSLDGYSTLYGCISVVAQSFLKINKLKFIS